MNSILLSPKVYLKKIEKEHIAKRVEWINDPDVQATLNYLNWPVSYAQTSQWFDRIVTDASRRDFSVFTQDGDKYIGACGFLNIEYPAMKSEVYAMIGDKEYWRGGYGTDTYRLLQDYGFRELGLKRIYGYQLVENVGAHKVVEKLGWKREGLLRNDIFSHGQIKDRYVVAILFDEWQARYKQ